MIASFVLCAALAISQPSPEKLPGAHTDSGPPARLQLGLTLALTGQHDESEKVLSGVDSKRVSHDLYFFVRLLNNFALNKKADAEKYATHLDDSFTLNLPHRYKVLAFVMKRELANWSTDGLDDIERDMRHAAGRLEGGKSDKRTQQVQKDVVDKLAKMIQEEEDRQKAKRMQAEGDAGGKPAGTIPVPGQDQPAQESVIMGTAGAGKVDEKALRQAAEVWGTLPPEKRAKVIQDMTRDVPAKYRAAIEEYFKALNRLHNK